MPPKVKTNDDFQVFPHVKSIIRQKDLVKENAVILKLTVSIHFECVVSVCQTHRNTFCLSFYITGYLVYGLQYFETN